jgi:magnesium transporter
MEELEQLKELIRELIHRRNWAGLRQVLENVAAPDISDLLLQMDTSERVFLFRFLPKQTSLEVFSHMESANKDELMTSLTNAETSYLLANLSPDDRTAFLEDLPGQVIQRLMNLLTHSDRREALQLLGYPEESVGRLMTPDYVAVRSGWSIGRCLEHIRKMGKVSETINVVYVTDSSWKLLDELELRRLILADPEQTVEEIMDYNVVSVRAEDDQEMAVQLIQRYDLYALPVVDSSDILLGIVTVDDILDVAEEEVTEDFHMTAAVTPLKTSYSEASVLGLFKKRIGWLLALVFVNLVASGIIAAYEDVLASVIALAFFIPLLNAGGGNVGAQSATLVIRAQATGDLSMGQWLLTALKELKVGALLGAGMGAISFLFGLLYGGADVALVVGISMLLIVVIINVVGVILPFLLVKARLDPAMASSPLITSLADAIGLTIYFTLAVRFLNIS